MESVLKGISSAYLISYELAYGFSNRHRVHVELQPILLGNFKAIQSHLPASPNFSHGQADAYGTSCLGSHATPLQKALTVWRGHVG